MQTNKKDRPTHRPQQRGFKAIAAVAALANFSSISITEIVESANYNRGTFYTHYDNKEALLDDILTPHGGADRFI